jgi:hypothetical protein
MSKNKTTFTDDSVIAFINQVDNEQKRADSLHLITLMQQVSGEEAKMYGPSIIGFGQYHYKYASGHEGDAPLLGFSPRKAAISLYVHTGCAEQEHLLEGLGKFKIAKACIYIKKLADIDEKVLINLMRGTIALVTQKYMRIKP